MDSLKKALGWSLVGLNMLFDAVVLVLLLITKAAFKIKNLYRVPDDFDPDYDYMEL